MNNTLGSYPGALRFRFVLVIVIMVILIWVFLSHSDNWVAEVESTAQHKTLSEINSALALTLYQMAMDKNLQKLSMLDKGNPFVYLAIYQSLPLNYHGTVSSIKEVKAEGWYFDLATRLVYYRNRSGSLQEYVMVFEYKDSNNTGKYEHLIDSITNLSIKKASSI